LKIGHKHVHIFGTLKSIVAFPYLLFSPTSYRKLLYLESLLITMFLLRLNIKAQSRRRCKFLEDTYNIRYTPLCKLPCNFFEYYSLVIVPFAALQPRFGPVEEVEVFTEQALSGAGYPGVSSIDVVGNVIRILVEKTKNLKARRKRF